jgi:hypothetical protein
MKKLFMLDGQNCLEAHIGAKQPGDQIIAGFALGPGEKRYAHCWIVRDGNIVDLFNWTEHEPYHQASWTP